MGPILYKKFWISLMSEMIYYLYLSVIIISSRSYEGSAKKSQQHRVTIVQTMPTKLGSSVFRQQRKNHGSKPETDR